MQQYEQNQVWTALEPDIASETAVLLSRPAQPLLEHRPNRTTFYVLLSPEKTKYRCSPESRRSNGGSYTYRRYFQHAHFIPIVGVGKRGEY